MSKNRYYPRLQYYENLLSKYQNIQSYHSLITEAIKRDSVRTSTPIAFYENYPFGSSPQEIKRALGKPNYQIRVDTDFQNLIFFYRLTIADFRLKCELHFQQNQLFHFNYTFSHLNPRDKKKIYETIYRKYLLEEQTDIANTYIIDPGSNIMLVQDHVYLSIDYFNPGSEVLSHARELALLQEKQEKEKLQKKEMELISRL